jgi:hypothetical protein
MSGSRGTLTALRRREGGAVDRDTLLVRAADAVLAHWPNEDKLYAAAERGLSGDDRAQAEFFAAAMILVREELGEAAVRQVRDRHTRRTA